MSQSSRHEADLCGVLTRRRLLRRGLAAIGAAGLGVAGVAGCTPSDPRVDDRGTSLPPKPTSSASAPEVRPPQAVDGEQELADLASAILGGPHRAELTAGRRRVVAGIRDAHRQHVAALRSPQPATPGPSDTPSLTPPPAGFALLTLAESIQLLARNESSQATRLQGVALDEAGADALLWGSMMAAATSYAGVVVSRAGVAVSRSPRARQGLTVVSDVAALQSLVRQLHAIIYGYQLALGQLPASGIEGRRALAALAARRRLRNRLVQTLISRSASVPVAAAAYVPPIQPTSARRSAALIRQMETALEPFCGLWVASTARPEDRRLALQTLAGTTVAAQRWGAPLAVWPGWLG